MKVKVEHLDGFRFLATARSHSVRIDAPLEEGGTDTAMSAPELFVASLGACMLSFVANSCYIQKMPFTQLSAEIEFEEIERPRRLDKIEGQIHIKGEIPEDREKALIRIARRCTLTTTIDRSPGINITLVHE